MALPRYTVHAASLLALTGLLSLLLADSTETICKETSIDLTFDVSTTCNGESAARIRINGNLRQTESFGPKEMQVVSGKMDIKSVDVHGTCSGEDEPFIPAGLTVTVAATAVDSVDSTTAAGSGRAMCLVLGSDLGKDVPCRNTDFPTVDCTLRLTVVP